MAGSFDFLHIKRRSAGSPNELSFDVLDAARTQLDGKQQKSSKAAKTPSSSKGSYHGVAGTSTLSAVPEVEKRKKARRSRILRVRFLVAALVVVAIGAASYAGYSFYQKKIDFSDRYRGLVAQLVEIDEALVKVDTAMGDPLASGDSALQAEATSRMSWISEKLDTLSKDVDSSIPYAMNDADKVALTQLNSCVEGRRDMLAAGQEAMQISGQHAQELAVATTAWNKVLNADQLVRESTAYANNASTDEATEAAKQMTQQALDEFSDARYELENITYRHEGVDFSAQIAYIDKRVEALGYAVATGDALIQGDRTLAASNNDAYNEADQEAARMAADLPLLLDDQVTEAFKAEIEPSVKKYFDARDRVLDADADVRAYLG